MSEHEEQSKGFKVTDRRSFTREGDRIARHEEEREMVDVAAPAAAPDARLHAESAGRLEPLFLDRSGPRFACSRPPARLLRRLRTQEEKRKASA